ncbi:uncharacterized protein [Dermacentor albipictus]|uniref:uncharacterized protein isoform X3 n=1 Tax=Dermacentor albipictus TaxID=60249 RepID=UPI0031FC4526
MQRTQLSIAVAFVLCATCCHGYVAVAPATMDGDNCLYEQLKIKNNETLHSEMPCESFHCDARHKVVYVEGTTEATRTLTQRKGRMPLEMCSSAPRCLLSDCMLSCLHGASLSVCRMPDVT